MTLEIANQIDLDFPPKGALVRVRNELSIRGYAQEQLWIGL